MKIQTLTVKEFRGIRHLTMPLEGRSAVIWGDNGVGKSGIIDAVDFVLRGDVTRLSGRGAGELSLARHGPHVRAAPEDVSVSIDLTLPDGEAHSVTRRLSSAGTLEATPAVAAEFNRVSDRGQHLLTRRDILSVVTVPPGDRAAQINQLLNLSPIELARTRLVTLRNLTTSSDSAASSRVAQQRVRLADIARLPAFDAGLLLNAINEMRGQLDLSPLDGLDDNVSAGAPPASPTDEAAARRVSAKEALKNFATYLSSPDTFAALERDLADACGAADSLTAIDDYARILQVAELVNAGASLLDGSGLCPLCDTRWDPAELVRHIDGKHDTTRVAQEAQAAIARSVRTLLGGVLNNLAARSRAALDALLRLEIDAPPHEWLVTWNAGLAQAIGELALPAKALSSPERQAALKLAVMPDEALAQRVTLLADSIPSDAEPEVRTASRERLIRTDQEVRNLREAESASEEAQGLAAAATLLHDSFLASRDELLGELYETVRGRFVEFYRFLHPEEAESFDADLGPTDRGGIDMAVDFHAAGRYPPNAVHSEGHQDSMGLCLFLALAEALTGGAAPDLLLLDDVVMSVDMDHRAKVAELLKVHFPATQFILTTHDRAWASYLQSSGVIRPADRWEFRTWDIETGPSVGRAADVWTRIDAQLDSSDVPSAAETLRRHVEETLFSVCDAIRAPVRLRASAQYQAGDLGEPAFQTLKGLIASGLRKARLLNDEAGIKRLETRESDRAKAHTDIKVHEWSVSAQIHWNNLLRLTANEFRVVAATYRRALALFECEHCHSPIRLLFDGDGRPSAVQCVCANAAWPL